MPYNSIISRDASNDPLVPTPVSAQIIQEMPPRSVMLQRARQVRMSTKTQRQPVLDVLPTAYFVNGDTGLKQTSAQDWKNVELVVVMVLGVLNNGLKRVNACAAAFPSSTPGTRAMASSPAV